MHGNDGKVDAKRVNMMEKGKCGKGVRNRKGLQRKIGNMVDKEGAMCYVSCNSYS